MKLIDSIFLVLTHIAAANAINITIVTVLGGSMVQRLTSWSRST